VLIIASGVAFRATLAVFPGVAVLVWIGTQFISFDEAQLALRSVSATLPESAQLSPTPRAASSRQTPASKDRRYGSARQLRSSASFSRCGEWVRRATDQLASRVGPAVGGLLTISFGSIAELVLALFVLMRGQTNVVQAQITGSILATSLFALGLAIIVGGSTRDRQHFSPERAGLLSSLLILVVIALLLPAVFDLTGRLSGQIVETRF
jgi:Ca2+/Na+ antiporter